VLFALWWMFSAVYMLFHIDSSDLPLMLINLFITYPIGGYVFYRMVRYVAQGR